MRVLIIEKSDIFRKVITAQILSCGYTPVFGDSYDASLILAKNASFDMAITSIDGGIADKVDLSGVAAIRDNETNWKPIICLTGFQNESHIVEAVNAGADDIVIKPFNRFHLQAKLHALARITKMRDQLETVKREMEQLSLTDGLTSLSNRRSFDDGFHRTWRKAVRDDEVFSLLFMDIDFFKAYNDHYGHAKGDECLKQVAESIKSSIHRPMDIAYRYGGEEFTVVLPGTDIRSAQVVASRILKDLHHRKIPHSQSLHNYVTLSIGVVCSTSFSQSDAMIKEADVHLYRAKSAGRNRFDAHSF